MKEKVTGVVVPLITPLKDHTVIDKEGLGRLIEYVIGGGADALFVLGTTGEGPCLSNEAKKDIIVSVNQYLCGRAKNLVGITDVSPEESIKWSGVAADNGADAVVVAPPPYFNYTQKELVDYVRYIVRRSPLPVILYNIPRLTKTIFEIETIVELANEDKVIGFKDSSKDWGYFQLVLQAIKSRPDWTILTGSEELLIKSVKAGADGGVLGGANLFPELLSGFCHAIKNINTAAMDSLETTLSNLRQIYSMGEGATSSIQVIKYVLELKGICSRQMTVPFKDMDDATGKKISGIIEVYSGKSNQFVNQ